LTHSQSCLRLLGMRTITTHEAKTHLSRFLVAVEAGEEFIIARGRKPVAHLSPYAQPRARRRPKVGQILGRRFKVPDDALRPLRADELAEWGL